MCVDTIAVHAFITTKVCLAIAIRLALRGAVGAILAVLAALAVAYALGALPLRRAPALALVAEPGPTHAVVDCNVLKSQRLMVVVVVGQSNAANHGQTPRRAANGVYSYYRGRCFAAQDPLPGASGDGGSVWTRLGDMIVARGMSEAVLFVPLAVGSPRVDQWTAGELPGRLATTIGLLKEQGFNITHLLWHQGEADAKAHTSAADYQRSFRAMLAKIREQGVTAPIYVSLATHCGATPDKTIREAQSGLVDPAQRILAGPDTDALSDEFRMQRCHFSDSGLARAATLWYDKLSNRP